jgi:hypothetical protein
MPASDLGMRTPTAKRPQRTPGKVLESGGRKAQAAISTVEKSAAVLLAKTPAQASARGGPPARGTPMQAPAPVPKRSPHLGTSEKRRPSVGAAREPAKTTPAAAEAAQEVVEAPQEPVRKGVRKVQPQRPPAGKAVASPGVPSGLEDAGTAAKAVIPRRSGRGADAQPPTDLGVPKASAAESNAAHSLRTPVRGKRGTREPEPSTQGSLGGQEAARGKPLHSEQASRKRGSQVSGVSSSPAVDLPPPKRAKRGEVAPEQHPRRKAQPRFSSPHTSAALVGGEPGKEKATPTSKRADTYVKKSEVGFVS